MHIRLSLALFGLAVFAFGLYAALDAGGASGPAAITLIVCGLAAGALGWILDTPIRRLASFAATMARGEAAPRLPETARGRSGDLYRSLNRIAENQRSRLEDLSREKSETELLLREMGEGVLALSASGTVARANAQMYRVLGSNEPIEGRALATLFRNPELVSFLDPQSVPEAGTTGEFDAFGRTMLVTARRLPAGGLVAVFSDLTLLRRLDTIRTEFVANASHELKTPLTAIRGFAETLVDNELSEEDRHTFSARIVEHSNRMNAIVDDLLTLARLEEPGHEVVRKALALRPLLEAVQQSFAGRLAAAGITLRLEVEPPDLEAVGDPEGLRQVVENLADNAIRHSGSAEIEIKALRTTAGDVRLSVSDHGRGIATADLSRIFERFYRVDPSRSRATGGTGLGLSIVKHWVEAMSGKVWAESEVGQGTRVHVSLPTPGAGQLSPSP